MANLRNRAVAIVSHRLHHQRHAAGTIALVSNLLVVDAFFFAGAATDRTFDGVVRHIPALGVEDRLTQTRVGIRIPAAATRRDGDLFNKLGEQLPALGIERALLMLDTMPLRMSGHRSRSFWECGLSGKAIYQRLRNYLNASYSFRASTRIGRS